MKFWLFLSATYLPDCSIVQTPYRGVIEHVEFPTRSIATRLDLEPHFVRHGGFSIELTVPGPMLAARTKPHPSWALVRRFCRSTSGPLRRHRPRQLDQLAHGRFDIWRRPRIHPRLSSRLRRRHEVHSRERVEKASNSSSGLDLPTSSSREVPAADVGLPLLLLCRRSSEAQPRSGCRS